MKLARPTRKMIRAKCSDCLLLKANKTHGYDCGCPDCPLYPAQPWRGREMAARLMDSIDRRMAEAKR